MHPLSAFVFLLFLFLPDLKAAGLFFLSPCAGKLLPLLLFLLPLELKGHLGSGARAVLLQRAADGALRPLWVPAFFLRGGILHRRTEPQAAPVLSYTS